MAADLYSEGEIKKGWREKMKTAKDKTLKKECYKLAIPQAAEDTRKGMEDINMKLQMLTGITVVPQHFHPSPGGLAGWRRYLHYSFLQRIDRLHNPLKQILIAFDGQGL